MKKVIISLLFHSASRRGCSLVVNLKRFCSFINTTPAGAEDPKGETILQMPEIQYSSGQSAEDG